MSWLGRLDDYLENGAFQQKDNYPKLLVCRAAISIQTLGEGVFLFLLCLGCALVVPILWISKEWRETWDD